MSVIHPGLFLIMRKFPSHKDHLRRLYLRSESFQTLCDDYKKCVDAMARWLPSGPEQVPQRSDEYLELMIELESEIEELIRSER